MKEGPLRRAIDPRSSKRSDFWTARWIQRVGPGFVYVLTAMGAGDLVSNSAAGAGYGYALIWTIFPAVIFRFVWVNVSAKYVLVTQESLIQGYARVGRWVIWILLISVLVLGHFYMMYTIVMTGNAIEALLPSRFRWSSALWSLTFAILAFVMTYWGGYRAIEKFLRVGMAVMLGGLVTAVVLARPDPAKVLQGALIPSIPGDQGQYGTLFIVMAIVGTMVGSITNLTYAYFIQEKGWWDASHLRQQRVDLLMSAFCLFGIAGLLQVAAGAVVHPLGIDLEDANDLVRIFSEVQGVVGMIIFGLGLWGMNFSSLIGMLVGFSLIVADLVRFAGKNPVSTGGFREDARTHWAYRPCQIFLAFSPLYVLLIGVSPVWLVLAVNALVVVLIPLLTPVLLILTNSERLMGQHRNHWFTNVILVVLMGISITIGLTQLLNHWKQWF